MHSVNTVSVQLIMQTGIDNVIELAHNTGIESPLPGVPSLALGTAELSLKEMVTAYCCFVNRGIPVSPYYLLKIEDNEGNILEEFTPPVVHERVFSEDNGRILLHMLESVVDSGTAKSIRNVYGLKGAIAAKTGTTQNNADGWFIGCTPELVAGVWVGGEDPAYEYIPHSRFKQPSGYILALADLPYYKANKREMKQAIKTSEVKLKKQETVMEPKKSKKPRTRESFFKRIKRFFKKKE